MYSSIEVDTQLEVVDKIWNKLSNIQKFQLYRYIRTHIYIGCNSLSVPIDLCSSISQPITDTILISSHDGSLSKIQRICSICFLNTTLPSEYTSSFISPNNQPRINLNSPTIITKLHLPLSQIIHFDNDSNTNMNNKNIVSAKFERHPDNINNIRSRGHHFVTLRNILRSSNQNISNFLDISVNSAINYKFKVRLFNNDGSQYEKYGRDWNHQNTVAKSCQFQCGWTDECLRYKSNICDGVNNCKNGYDEIEPLCELYNQYSKSLNGYHQKTVQADKNKNYNDNDSNESDKSKIILSISILVAIVSIISIIITILYYHICKPNSMVPNMKHHSHDCDGGLDDVQNNNHNNDNGSYHRHHLHQQQYLSYYHHHHQNNIEPNMKLHDYSGCYAQHDQKKLLKYHANNTDRNNKKFKKHKQYLFSNKSNEAICYCCGASVIIFSSTPISPLDLVCCRKCCLSNSLQKDYVVYKVASKWCRCNNSIHFPNYCNRNEKSLRVNKKSRKNKVTSRVTLGKSNKLHSHILQDDSRIPQNTYLIDSKNELYNDNTYTPFSQLMDTNNGANNNNKYNSLRWLKSYRQVVKRLPRPQMLGTTNLQSPTNIDIQGSMTTVSPSASIDDTKTTFMSLDLSTTS